MGKIRPLLTGNDSKLKNLIKKRHGNVPVHGVEVILAGDQPDENGRARLILPQGRIPSGTSTSTFTYISPDVTEAILKRIPTQLPKKPQA